MIYNFLLSFLWGHYSRFDFVVIETIRGLYSGKMQRARLLPSRLFCCGVLFLLGVVFAYQQENKKSRA
jgi:hypothetical protein